jgi:predicted small secreted protein
MTHISSSVKTAVRLIAVVVTIALATGGCHTMRGAGKDVKSAGRHIERSAE